MFRAQLLLPMMAFLAMIAATAALVWRYHDDTAYEASLERIFQEVEQSRANVGDMAY